MARKTGSNRNPSRWKNIQNVSPEDVKKAQRENEVIDKAQKNCANWFRYWAENIERGRIDRRFLFSSQWTGDEINSLRQRHKPVVQFNQLHDHVKKVVGEFRKNTPMVTVYAVNEEIDSNLIDIAEDIVTGVFYQSRNDIVDQTACENVLTFGYGAMWVLTEYENNESFHQIIKTKKISMPENVFFDPSAKEVDKGDGDFCGYLQMYTAEEIENYFGKTDVTSFAAPMEWNALFTFLQSEEAQIALCHYWQKEYFDKEIAELSDGSVLEKGEYNKLKKSFDLLSFADQQMVIQEIGEPFPEIKRTRKVKDYTIKGYILGGEESIKETEWPSKYLPGVYVDGYSTILDGKQHTQSFIHHAKDAQRLVNYCAVEILQALKNSRREPYLGTAEMTEGYEEIWRNPDLQQGMLLYKPHIIGNQVLTPQPQTPIPFNQAFLQQYERATGDVNRILGRFEAVSGEQSNEISGTALSNRIRQGNLGSFIYFDNVERAQESIGRIVLDLIPSIYDGERTLMLHAENEEPKKVVINQTGEDGKVMNDLTELKNKLEIRIKLGANSEMQRQEHLEYLMMLLKAIPESTNLVADLVAANIPVGNMPKLVERLKTLVPPAILAKEEGKEPPPPQPSFQEEMAKQEMQLKAKELELRDNEHQIQAAKLMMEGDKMQQETELTKMKTSAEIEKANIDRNAKIMSSLEKILGGNPNV
jgi:hypothetical protein